MKKISKIGLIFFLSSLALAWISTFNYIKFGRVGTKWGSFYNDMALNVVIAYWVFTVFIAFCLVKYKKNITLKKMDFICPNCEHCEKLEKLKNCPKCGNEMVPLKGFYEKNK